MQVETHTSEDVFLHVPELKQNHCSEHNVIYFITGNPGLLGYYRDFLLSLSSSRPSSACTIAGFSLGGFDVSPADAAEAAARIQHPPGSPRGPVYSLQDQIELTHRRIEALVEALARQGKRSCKLILIGHSVGAYIALEVIRKLHDVYAESTLRDGGTTPARSPAYTVTGAILLTPTVVDIAKSSQGRMVTPLLTYVPFLDNLAQWAAGGLVRTLPGSAVQMLVGRVTGMEGDKLRTTLAWLRSETGVKQTVLMGGQEMSEMGPDRWGEEVWGAVEDLGEGETGWKAPKLVLYFARKDHWINDVTRDEIGKARRRPVKSGEGAKDRSWPRIEVEESGRLVHGWCLEQSEEVAEKVKEWLGDMIKH